MFSKNMLEKKKISVKNAFCQWSICKYQNIKRAAVNHSFNFAYKMAKNSFAWFFFYFFCKMTYAPAAVSGKNSSKTMKHQNH